jgi:hypothetical protein
MLRGTDERDGSQKVEAREGGRLYGRSEALVRVCMCMETEAAISSEVIKSKEKDDKEGRS